MSRLSRLRPQTTPTDEVVERYLAALRAQTVIDPLFRRRLRGHVVNRFVAQREGIDPATRLPLRMGRIGRAALYASFAMGVSVTSVLAASQGALPGEPLYALKRNVEELRHALLPDAFSDELLAHQLATRIAEVGALAERGDWAAVAVTAGDLRRAHARYAALVGLPAAAKSHETDSQWVVLESLLERLPEAAREAVADVVADVEEREARKQQSPTEAGDGLSGGASAGGQDDHGGDHTPRPTPSARPSPEPRTPPPVTPRPVTSPASAPAPPTADPATPEPMRTAPARPTPRNDQNQDSIQAPTDRGG